MKIVSVTNMGLYNIRYQSINEFYMKPASDTNTDLLATKISYQCRSAKNGQTFVSNLYQSIPEAPVTVISVSNVS